MDFQATLYKMIFDANLHISTLKWNILYEKDRMNRRITIEYYSDRINKMQFVIEYLESLLDKESKKKSKSCKVNPDYPISGPTKREF